MARTDKSAEKASGKKSPKKERRGGYRGSAESLKNLRRGRKPSKREIERQEAAARSWRKPSTTMEEAMRQVALQPRSADLGEFEKLARHWKTKEPLTFAKVLRKDEKQSQENQRESGESDERKNMAQRLKDQREEELRRWREVVLSQPPTSVIDRKPSALSQSKNGVLVLAHTEKQPSAPQVPPAVVKPEPDRRLVGSFWVGDTRTGYPCEICSEFTIQFLDEANACVKFERMTYDGATYELQGNRVCVDFKFGVCKGLIQGTTITGEVTGARDKISFEAQKVR